MRTAEDPFAETVGTPTSTSTVQMSRGPSTSKEDGKPFNDMEFEDPALQDKTDYPSSLKLVSVIVALVLAVFLASLDMNIIATAIPRITDEFHSLDDVRPLYPLPPPPSASH